MSNKPTRRRALGAYAVYLAMAGGQALCFATIFTLSAVYRLQAAGLNPLELVLVGTVLELSAFLFEVPTGVVADTYSRRLSIVIGVVLIGLGAMLEGAFAFFPTILLAQVVWGMGYTFTSGATEAWLADEIGEANVGQAFLRAAQLGQVGSLLGIGACVALASVSMHLPYLVGGGLMVALGLFLAATMPETGFSPTPRGDRTTWGAMGATFRAGVGAVRATPVLVTFLLIFALLGMSTESFDRLWEAHFLTTIGFPAAGGLTPVVWLGIIDAVSMLLTIGAAEVVRRTVDTSRYRTLVRVLVAITGLQAFCLVAFGFAGGFAIAVAAYLGTRLFRRMAQPLGAAWVTQSIEPRVRATVLSMTGQADAIGQIAGGPIIGAIGTFASVRAAIAFAGAVLVPVLPLFARAGQQSASTTPIAKETPVT